MPFLRYSEILVENRDFFHSPIASTENNRKHDLIEPKFRRYKTRGDYAYRLTVVV